MQYPYLKRLPQFEYLAPKSVKEAAAMLAQYNGKARVLAGGTDLLLHMKTRKATPAYVIGLKSIPELDFLRYNESEGLVFGPLVTVHTFETAQLIKDKYPILAEAASVLGSVQVRNLATVVGNLCSALPSCDMGPGLVVLGARLKITGPEKIHTVPVEDFFKSPGESILSPGELVTEVQVPVPPSGSGMVYLKHMLRSAMDLSIVSVAALVVLKGGVCQQARICLGTVGLTPMRAVQAEEVLKGRKLDSGLIEKAAGTASQESRPRDSMRSTAEYRREMVKVLTIRALKQIAEKDG